jgi:hypothetical protein
MSKATHIMLMQIVFYIFCVVAVAVSMLLVLGKPLLTWARKKEFSTARERFRGQREQLEARFFDLASVAGKPRDLRWVDCEWLDTVTFARDLTTNQLAAFAAVNISFEAVEGGDMEDVEAVGTVRDAAAVFHYHNGHWGTGGRALFNMNPEDAISRLQGQFEALSV